jgi:acyl dehydratase
VEGFYTTIIITPKEVEDFASLTGDYNPIHFDLDFASTTIFKKPIVHGPLLLIKITSIFANNFPGPGTVYLGHDYKFLKPIYIGEQINIQISLITQNEKKHLFVSTKCFNKDGDMIFDGVARLKKF